MKNIPEIIHLNIGAVEGDESIDFKDCQAVTWSEDRVYPDDIKYIHSRTFNLLQSDYALLKQENNRLSEENVKLKGDLLNALKKQ